MKLKFGGQLIEPAVSPSSGIGEAKTDVPADRGAVPPGVSYGTREAHGALSRTPRSVTFAAILPGVPPERTNALVRWCPGTK